MDSPLPTISRYLFGMSAFPVSEGKRLQLEERMRKLGIFEADLDETFARSSGAGGQHVNKTSTCVMLLHLPTGTRVRCQQERSQAMNRFLARRWLCDKIEQEREGRRSAIEQEREKIRRQKRRRSRRAKEKMLRAKHERSEIKESRRKDRFD